MDGESEKNGGSKYEAVAERCRNLEASLATLREQFHELSSGGSGRQEQMMMAAAAASADLAAAAGRGGDDARWLSSSYPGWGNVSGAFLSGGSPYKKILDCMGHALHVSRPTSTHDIIYWNKCAEKLYGYKEDEVLGESGIELLASEEDDHEWIRSIEERIRSRNDSWSGLFPCKKRSGHTFMAMVTKTPLYDDDDDDEVSGVITVSSDASILNIAVSPTLYPRRFRKTPHSRPPVASYVANLAAAKVFFSKLNIAGIVKLGKDKFGNKYQPNGCRLSSSASKEAAAGYIPTHTPIINIENKMLSRDAIQQPQPQLEYNPQSPKKVELVVGSSNRDDLLNKIKNRIGNYEIRWEDISLKEEIGQGSFGTVHRGIWNGSDVAVKVYRGQEFSEGTLLDYKKEIDLMKRLRHPNVLLFMGAVSSQEKLAIITEFLPRGSLFKTLHKNSQHLDIRRRLRMALDVARGMNYLHTRNPPIVHRDLKSSNLLVDKSWTVKVGDFGLSKLKNATLLSARSGRGTPHWMAPEVLRNEHSTEKCDVFSFSVVLWELMTESIPWSTLSPLQVVGVVGFMDRRLEVGEDMDPRVSSIIQDCWQSVPEHRPSFHDIIPRVVDVIQAYSTGKSSGS
ncbi:unnamed protein product [Cuscuta campestris]|uniref:non-specific serine/threonine protein kinase n=1 Tax=Cuscuta campestris TaxID=132261 RepID=A0A484KUH9_9ASTE|nr:unnamed protein product [Cuscuta campestris]